MPSSLFPLKMPKSRGRPTFGLNLLIGCSCRKADPRTQSSGDTLCDVGHPALAIGRAGRGGLTVG